MLRLLCPNCKNYMNYQPTKTLEKARKKCVYCGKSFTVKKQIIRSV